VRGGNPLLMFAPGSGEGHDDFPASAWKRWWWWW